MRWFSLTLVGVVAIVVSANARADEKSLIGRKIENFKLQDFRGAPHELKDLSDREILVVAFVGTECPVAKLYGPRLAELAAKYEPKNIGFLAIDSNQQDTLAEMAQYARVAKVEFPFLKDPSNTVANLFGAVRTPEVFVLDKERAIRYRGRIDDQHGIGVSRPKAQRNDLSLALDELLAGKEIATPLTQAAGCHISRVNRRPAHGDITYAKDIAPIVQTHCVACHRSGEIAPFALASYEDVVNWSATIREVIEEKRMPPWHASGEPGKFANDRRLPEREKELLFAWIGNGMPAGDSADLTEPVKLTDGWQISKPDLIVEMPKPYTVAAKGTIEYQYFPLEQTFDEDKWVVAAEARPGNRSVVHHLILMFVPPGAKYGEAEAALFNSIAAFAPGVPAWNAPPGMAKRIPAGSKLYFQVHYTPNGAEALDLSRAGVIFIDPRLVEKQLQTDAVINPRLNIPPGDDNVRIPGEYRFRRDMRLISILPHMHLRGKAFRIETVDPEGKRELVLDVPKYDFNWQNNYEFATPLRVREGTLLNCLATYDNSDKNPANPDPKQTVRWGDQTWEEMLVAQFETVLEDQDLRLGRPTVQPAGGNEFDVEFKFRPKAPAQVVYLAGTFNEWKPTDQKMEGPDKSGTYSTRLKLKAGAHEYKFVIDGKTWRSDPGNPDFAGSYANSVLKIGPPNARQAVGGVQ